MGFFGGKDLSYAKGKRRRSGSVDGPPFRRRGLTESVVQDRFYFDRITVQRIVLFRCYSALA